MCLLTLGTALFSTFASVGASVLSSVGVSTAAASTAATVAGVTTTVAVDLSVMGALAGGITGMVSGIQSAEQQKQAAEYQAEIAERNAVLAERRADRIEQEGNQKRAALLRELYQKQGSGRAGYAARGVVLGAGTTGEYEADIANAYDLDRRNLDYDIASRKWEKSAEAVNFRNQAELYRMEAASAGQKKASSLIGGMIGTVGNTAGALVGGASLLGSVGGLGQAASTAGSLAGTGNLLRGDTTALRLASTHALLR